MIRRVRRQFICITMAMLTTVLLIPLIALNVITEAMSYNQTRNLLEQIAKAIAAQFGSNCEVVIHELSGKSAYSSIVAIENGHVTGRKVGDGPSHVVLEQLGHEDDNAEDQLGYLTRTKDGKILKSSSVYIRDETGKVTGILGINYDISMMQLFENSLHDLI